MKFSACFISIFFCVSLVIAGSIKGPADKYIAFPLAYFDFDFDVERSSDDNIGSVRRAVESTEAVDIGLQTTPIGDEPEIIPVGKFNSTAGFSGKVQLPIQVSSGSYYLIVNETTVGTSGVTWHVHNQTFIVL